MTRKDYILIADAIAAERDAIAFYAPRDMKGADRVAYKLAAALRSDNPRFDTKHFLAACGITF